MATGTDPTQIQTVSRETSALLQVSPEKVPTAQAAVEEVARATVLSWAPNTTKSYLVGWDDFTSWCIEHNCPGLPAAPDVVGRYLEDLVETQGKALTTARNRLAAIAAAHRLGKHPDPVKAPLVKATLKRLARVSMAPRYWAIGAARSCTTDVMTDVSKSVRVETLKEQEGTGLTVRPILPRDRLELGTRRFPGCA